MPIAEPPLYDLATAAKNGGAKTMIEAVFSRLREDILSGRHQPGERLRVEQLRKEFGVGASTIREALSRLMSESLVTTEGQRGFRVSAVSLQDFRDIAEMRKILETIALRSSIEHGDDDWEAGIVAAYHRLSKVEERLADKPDEVASEWGDLNQAFHDALISACGNRWLLNFRKILHDQSNRYLRLSLADTTAPRNVHAEHEAIFKAVMARKPDEASELVGTHIDRTVGVIAKQFEGKPEAAE
ncbi:GntR family transcriptional regulator [Rhodobium gokarnense]|uniref:DNA-binding GntR family transcriptional regulator n=1 Tax=Rhodobium gokarnense TaxID=364296 RepID=A0ABT3HFD2_9HYPH|nr:FCD domain-containing protein [Rhodobium gokarnense]MCW2309111.1 DNA-binding GntR family transcriptional regulator [Rhodobium gokarnense]